MGQMLLKLSLTGICLAQLKTVSYTGKVSCNRAGIGNLARHCFEIKNHLVMQSKC